MLNAAKGKTDSLSRWAVAVEARRGYWKAVVAIAAKNARMCWAVLSRGESFKLPALRSAAVSPKYAAPKFTLLPAAAPP